MADDILTGGTATASTTESGHPASDAVDDNLSTRWNNNNSLPAWWKYDLGVGNSATPTYLCLYKVSYDQLKTFTLSGSNNDVDWDELISDVVPPGLNVWREYSFSNSTAYRYFKIDMPDSYSGTWVSIGEIELYESTPIPDARITHAVVEVLRAGDPDARITHAVVEVLRGVEPPSGDSMSNFFLLF